VKVLDSLVQKHFGKGPKAWEGKHGLYRAVQDKIGNSPMHLAAMEGDILKITELKEAGTDISVLSSFKKSPMHSAAWNGHAPVIDFLTEAGASVSTQDMLGYSPLHWAALRTR
jgi:ankyrin repeat protein